jgi:hypothetical protein
MKNITIKELIITFFWAGCLLSINSNQNDFLYLLNNFKNISNLFVYYNAARFIFPFIIFTCVILWFVTKKKNNLFVILFLTYSTWQIVILNVNNKYSNNLDDYQLIVCLISSLLILYTTYKNNKLNNILFMIIMIFISVIGVYFTVLFISELSINNKITYLYNSETLKPDSLTFSQTTPKVTGFSRLLLLISYLLFFILFYAKHNFKYILYIFIFLINLFIYTLQSRGTLVGELILIIYYILLFKDKVITKIVKVFFLFLLPIIIFELSAYYVNKKNDLISKKSSNLENYKIFNRILNNHSSSGRLAIWNNSFNIIKENKIIFGIGPQADRKLISEYLLKNNKKEDISYGNNASNALIYSYLCGGLINLSLLLFIYFLAIKELFKSIIVNKLQYYSKDPLVNFSIITLIFMITRSIFENGFSLFGIDFCFFCFSYFFLAKKNSEKIKK